MDTVIKEHHEDAEREAAERKELEAKYQQAVEYITSLGLDPEVYLVPVSAIAGTTETKRKPKGRERKANYIFEDENGDTKTWSGNGKMPLALRKQLIKVVPWKLFSLKSPANMNKVNKVFMQQR